MKSSLFSIFILEQMREFLSHEDGDGEIFCLSKDQILKVIFSNI